MTSRRLEIGRLLFTGYTRKSSAGRRYSPYGFLDQVIGHSKEINEGYVPVQVSMVDGTSRYGVIANLEGDRVK